MTEIAASEEELEKARIKLQRALDLARETRIQLHAALLDSRQRRERAEARLRRAGLLRD